MVSAGILEKQLRWIGNLTFLKQALSNVFEMGKTHHNIIDRTAKTSQIHETPNPWGEEG